MDQADREQHREPACIDERCAAAGRAPLSSRPSWRWKPMPNSRPNIRLNLPAKSRSRSHVTQPSSGAEVGRGRREQRMAEARHVHNEDAEAGRRRAARRAPRCARPPAAAPRRFGVDSAVGIHEPTVANAARRPVGANATTRVRSMFRYRHCRQPAQALVACRDREALARVESRRPRARARQGRCHAALAEGAGGRGPRRSSATASSRASTSCTASSPRSKASTSSTR